MQRLAAVALVLLCAQAFAATAFWTGKMNFGTSVTGMAMVSCEYNYAGRTFWRGFAAGTACPSSVEVQ